MKKILHLILSLLLIIPFASVSQTRADSLKQQLSEVEGVQKINILAKLSDYYARRNPDLSLSYDSAALQIAVVLKNDTIRSNILNNMGFSFYAKSDVATAIDLISQSLEIKKDIGDTIEIVKTLNNLGTLFQIIGDFDQAIALTNRSLEIRRRRNDLPGIARTLSNLSVILYKTDQEEQSLAMLDEALGIYEQLNDVEGIATIHNNRGNVYQKIGDFDKAEHFFLKSLELKDPAENPRTTAVTWNNLGMVAQAKENYPKALDYYLKALELRLAINDKFGLATVKTNLGTLHRLLNDFDKAREYLLDAYEISRKENFKEPLQRCSFELALLYRDIDRFEDALQYSFLALAYKDSIYSDELNKRIADLENQRRTQLTYREKEILRIDNELKQFQLRRKNFNLTISFVFSGSIILILILLLMQLREKRRLNISLEKSIEKLTKSESKLRQANLTKDKFFSIIAHDLINPFNAILGFSNLLANDYDDFSDEEKKSFILNLHEAATGNFRLLQNLLDWSRTQTGKLLFKPEDFDIADVIKDTVSTNKTMASNKAILVASNIEQDTFVYADKNMAHTILRNLISNAIKFTPRGGAVNITGEKLQDRLIISVVDSGIGINKEQLEDIFEITNQLQRSGTENEKGSGLGLMLCAEFVRQNGGKIWVESVENEGTAFYFTLMLRKEDFEKTLKST